MTELSKYNNEVVAIIHHSTASYFELHIKPILDYIQMGYVMEFFNSEIMKKYIK